MTFGGQNGSGKTSKEAAMPSQERLPTQLWPMADRKQKGEGGCKDTIEVESLKLGIYLDEEVLRKKTRANG